MIFRSSTLWTTIVHGGVVEGAGRDGDAESSETTAQFVWPTKYSPVAAVIFWIPLRGEDTKMPNLDS
jgi:hypothetical protein